MSDKERAAEIMSALNGKTVAEGLQLLAAVTAQIIVNNAAGVFEAEQTRAEVDGIVGAQLTRGYERRWPLPTEH